MGDRPYIRRGPSGTATETIWECAPPLSSPRPQGATGRPGGRASPPQFLMNFAPLDSLRVPTVIRFFNGALPEL